MDLRPKRCREMAEAIYDNMIARGLSDDPEVMEPIIEEWVELLVPLWTSHSLPGPGGAVFTQDDSVAAAFIAKYPRLQELIDLCQAEALRRWPEATFQLEVCSDPEGCHVCREGQSLTLKIQTTRPGPGNPVLLDAAEDAFDAWTWTQGGPYQALEADIGDAAFHLFRHSFGWKT